VAYYREKSFTCYTRESCKLPLAERSQHEPANDCVGCHMLRKGRAGILHSDDTNHRIVGGAGQPYDDYTFQPNDPDLPGLACLDRRGEDAAKRIPPLVGLLADNELMLAPKPPVVTRHYRELLARLGKSAPDELAVLAFSGREALADLPVKLDLVACTPKDVEEWSEVPQAFVTTAMREGTTIYERRG